MLISPKQDFIQMILNLSQKRIHIEEVKFEKKLPANCEYGCNSKGQESRRKDTTDWNKTWDKYPEDSHKARKTIRKTDYSNNSKIRS